MKPINPLTKHAEATFDAIDKAMQIAVDQETTDELIAQLARAHVGATRVEMIVHAIDIPDDQPRVYADEARKQLPPKRAELEAKLPPVQKQLKPRQQKSERPGITKLMKKAIEYDCPSCHAYKGERCFKMTGPGNDSKPTTERRDDDWVHRSRQLLATDHNNAAKAKYDRQHFEANGS